MVLAKGSDISLHICGNPEWEGQIAHPSRYTHLHERGNVGK